MRTLFTGFNLTWARLYIALSSFFICMDAAERHQPALFQLPGIGPFLKGSVCASVGWVLAWPLEVLKSQAQSGLFPAESALKRLQRLLRERGLLGLYRGFGPGMARSLLGNGAAVTAFELCKSCSPVLA